MLDRSIPAFTIDLDDALQKNLFTNWLLLAKEADYNVVWLPLSANIRKDFNETAAVEAFKKYEGLPYGFPNLLWGWIDGPTGNSALSGVFLCSVYMHALIRAACLDRRLLPLWIDTCCMCVYKGSLYVDRELSDLATGFKTARAQVFWL